MYRVKGRAKGHKEYSQVVPPKKTWVDEHITLTWQKPERFQIARQRAVGKVRGSKEWLQCVLLGPKLYSTPTCLSHHKEVNTAGLAEAWEVRAMQIRTTAQGHPMRCLTRCQDLCQCWFCSSAWILLGKVSLWTYYAAISYWCPPLIIRKFFITWAETLPHSLVQPPCSNAQ